MKKLKNKFTAKSDTDKILIRGLEILKDARQVFINRNEVNLAQKEFELLLYMAENPNRVFNREFLFEKIWGLDAMGDNATVTVHIRRIREKTRKFPIRSSIYRNCLGSRLQAQNLVKYQFTIHN